MSRIRGDAVAAIEMIVDQQAGDPLAGGLDRLDGGVGIGHRDDFGVPGGQQRSHAVQDRRIVLDATISEPLIGARESGVALVTAAV